MDVGAAVEEACVVDVGWAEDACWVVDGAGAAEVADVVALWASDDVCAAVVVAGELAVVVPERPFNWRRS